MDNNAIDTIEPGALTPLMFECNALSLDGNRLTYPVLELLLVRICGCEWVGVVRICPGGIGLLMVLSKVFILQIRFLPSYSIYVIKGDCFVIITKTTMKLTLKNHRSNTIMQ